MYVMKKVYNFFQAQNRQAKALEDLTVEVREQRKKLDTMMDGSGVDMRVEPVIQAVSHLNERSARIEKKQDEIFGYIITLVQRDPKSRPGDPQ
jgi:hypothetical protein